MSTTAPPRVISTTPARHHLRVARPASDLVRTRHMYCRGLGLSALGEFTNHAGIDGIMLGVPGAAFHFEFTRSRSHPVVPTPTPDDLSVFYIPSRDEWLAYCANMIAAGFRQVESLNPYWDERGRTFEDHDGYRVVLQNDAWDEVPPP